MELQHFGHQHPLVYRSIFRNIGYDCKICKYYLPHNGYGCDSCRYYVHEECTKLGQQMSHPFHSHPLSLITDGPPGGHPYTCDSCHRNNPYGIAWYRCEQCDFYMDRRCALSAPTGNEDEHAFPHFTHQHPMTLLQLVDETYLEYKRCYACGLACSGRLCYGCQRDECEYFLHKWCAEVPREIEHPFHPQHSLSLCAAHTQYSCKLCAKLAESGFAFKCQHCDLWLCLLCGTSTNLSRPIKCHEVHEHPLYFVDESRSDLSRCSGYETYCKQQVLSNCDELSRTCSSVLRCVECDFSLHLLCGPLPRTVKHDCHVHPLTLFDSAVEDGYDQQYCDVCETERNPQICVYYCQNCKFAAHVHCVLSEIIKVLKGNVSDRAELKTVGDDAWDSNDKIESPYQLMSGNSVMTLKDVINNLNTVEKYRLQRRYTWDDAASSQGRSSSDYDSTATTQGDVEDKEIERILKLSRFSDKTFNAFIWELNDCFRTTKLELKSSDLALKIVKVRGYMIPQTLAPVLRALLQKYGDLSPSTTDSFEFENILYFLLCRTVKQMSRTKNVDLTRDLLREWFHHLKFVYFDGNFKINFACSQLESLIRVFLGAQSRRLEHEIPKKMEQKIIELEKEFARNKSKLLADLTICKEYGGASPKSDFMKGCEKMALECKWNDASKDLLSRSLQADISQGWEGYSYKFPPAK